MTHLLCPDSILDLVHDNLLVRDAEGRITQWSKGCELLYGFPKKKAVGAKAHELLRTVYPTSHEKIDAVLQKHGSWQGGLRQRNASDQEVVVRAEWTTSGDAIIERLEPVEVKTVDPGLDLSEYRYRNLFQAMAASFWELDFRPAGDMLRKLRKSGVTDFRRHFEENPGYVRELMRVTRIIDVNETTVSMYGANDRAQLFFTLDTYWPESSTHVFAESVLAAISGAPNYVTETRLRRTNGEDFDALFTVCFPPGTVANGTLLVGVIDISERKKAHAALEQSEARYRNLFNSMGVACYQIDTRRITELFVDLRERGVEDASRYIDDHPEIVESAMAASIVTDANERAVALLGARDKSEIVGHPVTPYWLAADYPTFRRSLDWRYTDGAFEAETKQRTIDGRVIDVLFVCAAPASLREAGMALVSLVDISERVRAQGALQKLQDDFVHAARVSMLGELTASLAHEINQPLTAIAANAAASLRWLAREDRDEVVSCTKRVIADSQRAGEIIRRIHGMASRRAPERSKVSINDIVQESLQFIRHELRAKGVTTSTHLVDAMPDVLGDRTQLQQVIVNLSMNAIQAMHASSAKTLEIATTLAGTVVAVTVDDTGPGVGPGDHEKLFESFYTTKPDGMGMGLPICRSIIEAHGGTIRIDTSPSGGARFSFALPAALAS